jgi:hypothetical protein
VTTPKDADHDHDTKPDRGQRVDEGADLLVGEARLHRSLAARRDVDAEGELEQSAGDEAADQQ